jgi:hypothetical protein
MRGEVNIPSAAVGITRQLWRRVAMKASPMMGRFSSRNRLKAQVRSAFRNLQVQGKPVALVYSDRDPGLEQFHLAFGSHGKGLAQFPNASFTSLENADHNVTAGDAQNKVIAMIAELAQKIGPR